MKKIQEITRSVEVAAGPDVCYAVVCDIPGYRSWFRHVKSLDIKERDGEGRPAMVYFTFDLLIKKGLQIVLVYEYDDDGRTLMFRSGGGNIAGASGYYHFKELSPGRSRFVFRVKVDFGMLLPEALVEFLSGSVLDDFMAMVKAECERRAVRGTA